MKKRGILVLYRVSRISWLSFVALAFIFGFILIFGNSAFITTDMYRVENKDLIMGPIIVFVKRHESQRSPTSVTSKTSNLTRQAVHDPCLHPRRFTGVEDLLCMVSVNQISNRNHVTRIKM